MFMADGGGGSIATNFGSALSADVANMTSQTQKLVDAAKGGGFKITPEGVQPLRVALLDLAQKLDSLSIDTALLDEAPQLGGHPYGHTVAAHDQKGASQADGSARIVLSQLRDVVTQADEALARAAGLYNEAEHQAAAATTNIQV